MNRKRKGSRNELKSKRYLAEKGYCCTKAGGSLGAWDLIAIDWKEVLLIQVKSIRMPGRAERKRLQEFVAPLSGVRKVIHIWHDGDARQPEVRKWFDPATNSVFKGQWL